MKTISKKTKWVATDGWRGKEVPVNAIAGCNDTGTCSDSPCNSNVRQKEISLLKTELRKAGIKHLTKWGQTSNVFCSVQYVLVHSDDRDKAISIADSLRDKTSLLYAIKH